LGFYSKAVNVAQMLWLISSPISNVLFPYLNDPDKTDHLKVFTFYSRLNFTIVFAGIIFLFFISPIFFPTLFGEAFSSSVLSFKLLLAGILASSATKLFGAFASSRNKIHFNIITTLVGLAVTIFLDFTLIPKMGITGAAIASSCSYIISLLTLLLGLFVFLKIDFKNYFLLTLSDYKALIQQFKSKKTN
jgi:O-antigen/teichoic acid export membrane protein